jgi:hypothetical protein
MSTKLPQPVAAYIQATNDHDSATFLASFTEDALVNDIQREFWGRAAIGKWAEREIFGAEVTMEVVRAVDHYGDLIVTAKLDSNYDKTGLPDPFVLTILLLCTRGPRSFGGQIWQRSRLRLCGAPAFASCTFQAKCSNRLMQALATQQPNVPRKAWEQDDDRRDCRSGLPGAVPFADSLSGGTFRVSAVTQWATCLVPKVVRNRCLGLRGEAMNSAALMLEHFPHGL